MEGSRVTSEQAQKAMAQKPSIGRIVHYKLTAGAAQQINLRRTNSASIAERISADKWPLGAQAHIGNLASEGDVLPMIIVAVNGADSVNGQAFLDGTDVLWVSQAWRGDTPGDWDWPPRN